MRIGACFVSRAMYSLHPPRFPGPKAGTRMDSHRPEEILEVQELVEAAAQAMAAMLLKSYPGCDPKVILEDTREEFSCCAEDLGYFYATQHGSRAEAEQWQRVEGGVEDGGA